MSVEDDATITVKSLGDVVEGWVVCFVDGIEAGLLRVRLMFGVGCDMVADDLPLIARQRAQRVRLDLAVL